MKNLYAKLLEFQKEVGAISKDSTNPFFKSNYFDINKLISEVKPLLSKLGLVLLQPLTNQDGKSALSTAIVDCESGEKWESIVILPENNDPQKMGSIITYFRRYAIQSMLFLQAQDDDGNLASNQPQNSQTVNHTTQAVKTPVKPNLGQINDSVPFPDEPPFESKPQETPEQLVRNLGFTRPALVVGDKCARCADGKVVLNPKTGKLFCDKKCFLQGK